MGAQDPTLQETDTPVGISISPAHVASAEPFWTAERMAAAQPLDLLLLSDAPPADVAAAPSAAVRATAVSGAPYSVAGRGPLISSAALAQALYPEAWGDLAADAGMDELASAQTASPGVDAVADYYPFPSPFTRYSVNTFTQTWKSYPWSAVGKVFFTIPGRGFYACSGAVAAGRAIWTAGHCLYTPGVGWHTNVTFVPAFRSGVRPYGTFYATYLLTTSQWQKSGTMAYDVAMFTVGDSQGRKVSDWVGYLGAAFNQSTVQQFHMLGYPGNILNAQYLIACAASTARTDTGYTPSPVGAGCDMGGGSSGGPWLRRFAPYTAGSYNYVNALMSYVYALHPNEPYSPYFGDAVQALYSAMRYK